MRRGRDDGVALRPPLATDSLIEPEETAQKLLLCMCAVGRGGALSPPRSRAYPFLTRPAVTATIALTTLRSWAPMVGIGRRDDGNVKRNGNRRYEQSPPSMLVVNRVASLCWEDVQFQNWRQKNSKTGVKSIFIRRLIRIASSATSFRLAGVCANISVDGMVCLYLFVARNRAVVHFEC